MWWLVWRFARPLIYAVLGTLLVVGTCMQGTSSTTMLVQHAAAPTLEPFATATPRPPSPGQTAIPVPTIAPSTSDWPFDAIIAEAMTWLGVRYQWGGCTKRAGVDCSCFVMNVLGVFGIRAPRVTTQQVRWVTPVARADLRPTDLVFFDNTCTDCGANPTHVGMFIGNGLMVQAGGSQVSVQPVFSGFYGARFSGAGRPHR